jgi:hypothetical protein
VRASVRGHEWHLDFYKAFDHIKVNLLSRLCPAVVVLRPSFRHAWLKAVGSIRDALLGDRVEQLLIEFLSVLNTAVCLISN